LGGLGRIFARYLLETGEAVKVILSGRSALNEAAQRQLAELSPNGGTIDYLQVDVSQKAAVEQALAQLKAKYGRLNGVIHAAGVIRDNFILKKTEAEIEAVLAPKVAGTLNLDLATAPEPLDFMVLFASVTGIKGNAGQADYAAANAFLDSFALYRQKLVAQGQRSGQTVAISWPLWQAGGMQVAAPTLKLLAGQGIAPLATKAGLKAFEAILASEASQIVVAAGDLDRLRARGLGFGLGQPPLGANPGVMDTSLLRQKVQSETKTLVAGLLKIKRQDVAGDEEWGEYGFDSLTLTEFANRLNESYSLELTPPVLYEYNTLEALSSYLVERYGDRLSQHYQLEPAIEPIKLKPKLAPKGLANPRIMPGRTESKASPHEPIAIIGMSGILPGSPDLETYWQHLEAGQPMITEIPPERWDWRDHYGDPQQDSGKTRSKWGGFIPDVDKFDPLFFKISPKEAQMMDPQHRLFLQCAWHCLEDAGYRPSALAGRPVGVFVGVQFQDYQELLTRSNLEINPQIGTGNSHALLANRLSYLLDWRGPSEAIDTACSSSLVAIHRAVRAIRSGEIESALAGGVSLALSPSTYVVTAQMGVLSPDGKGKTFDKAANGYVKGEGVGAVFLKPLHQAEADGDHIYGVIRGSAENHGGRATSLTAPNPKAQADLLVTAYQDAGIEPDTVSYIETHGTGTVLGDPIEIEGLKQAFARLSEGQAPKRYPYCGLGSVKTNIGHLEPAAGIAGLFKILLALKHQTLPATLNFTEQNPYIDLKETPFYLVTKTQLWQPLRDEADKPLPRRAGLSSFGFGGANAHLVLEEYVGPDSEFRVQSSEFRVQSSELTRNSVLGTQNSGH
jgi:3-oxoacyl-(acyl-carrier-protein) synthase/acyl carrier protein